MKALIIWLTSCSKTPYQKPFDMLISSAFLTPGLSTFSQGLLAVPRDRHLGGLPWPHRKFSAPASSLEGGWDQENSFSEEAWGPQRAEARLGYSQGAGKQPRCGWRAHITGRELENDLGVAGGHTSQAGVFPACDFLGASSQVWPWLMRGWWCPVSCLLLWKSHRSPPQSTAFCLLWPWLFTTLMAYIYPTLQVSFQK